MISKTVAVFRQLLVMSTTLLTIGITATASFAQVNKVYSPLPLPSTYEVTDSLTDKDIPTGQGGFARDYTVKLNKGENLAVDLASDSFDSIITLLGPNGSTVAENDDGPDGSSNSLLFTRISETGSYIVRVRSFGETGVGAFKLKVTRLEPVKK
ncbi:peptidase domain-containing protein [Rivularia sp. IAM M-261]|nr:peptidase domain-containing protein [Calothrix sp. PCC 7716]GJD17440.1 peptidase domain-containing protein [Rivularia sp. IAM M-261]